MTLIEASLIEEGPQPSWLKQKSLGRSYKIYESRSQFCVSIYNKYNTRINTECAFFETKEEAISWGRRIFINYLIKERLIPTGGVILEQKSP